MLESSGYPVSPDSPPSATSFQAELGGSRVSEKPAGETLGGLSEPSGQINKFWRSQPRDISSPTIDR
jgi:hypothetical protein